MHDIRNVLVIGAGTMGHSLALLFAKEGLQVSLVDKNQAALERAVKLIGSAGKTLLKAGLFTSQNLELIPSRIKTTTHLESAAMDSDLAVETVDENPVIKNEIFTQLDRYCPTHTILCSNTSGLDIFSIVDTNRPEKILITHFFAPPHIIPLVEVVPGHDTSPEVVDRVTDFLKSLGKDPLRLKEYIPGFIVNRIQRAIAREAFSLVDKGFADIQEIDQAVKASLGIRLPVVGVRQTFDFTGLDAYFKIYKATPIETVCAPGPPRVVKEKVEKGELGIKTGKGLYDYTDRSAENVLEKRDLNYLRILSAMKQNTPL